MRTYTSTDFRQNIYHLINQVTNSDTPIRITSHNKRHTNDTNTYLVNSKIIKEAQKYHEIKALQNELNNIAKHSRPMNKKEFKRAIGL